MQAVIDLPRHLGHIQADGHLPRLSGLHCAVGTRVHAESRGRAMGTRTIARTWHRESWIFWV